MDLTSASRTSASSADGSRTIPESGTPCSRVIGILYAHLEEVFRKERGRCVKVLASWEAMEPEGSLMEKMVRRIIEQADQKAEAGDLASAINDLKKC